jgi:hypothetical protein
MKTTETHSKPQHLVAEPKGYRAFLEGFAAASNRPIEIVAPAWSLFSKNMSNDDLEFIYEGGYGSGLGWGQNFALVFPKKP